MRRDRIYAGRTRQNMDKHEAEVVRVLSRLPDPWAIVHNVLLPSKYRNYAPDETDIILIGPPGVYSIEVKWWTGEVVGEWHMPWVHQVKRGNPSSRPSPVKTATEKNSILYSVLRERMRGQRVPPVMGAVIFPPADKCVVQISNPYGVQLPLLNLDKALEFFRQAETDARYSRNGRRYPLREDEINRILDEIVGPPAPPAKEMNVGQWILTQPLPGQATDTYMPYLAYNPFVPSQRALVKELNLNEYEENYTETLNRLMREVQVLFEVRGHPNVVQVFGPFSFGDKVYVAQELVTGPTLADELTQGKTPSRLKLLKDMMPVMDALRFAHAHNIIHRSLSPQTLVRTPEGFKITDFGTARPLLTGTQTRMTVTSKPYSAPELERGAADPRSDIYSLGAICYEIVTKCSPASSDVRYRAKDPHLSFDSKGPAVPIAIQDFIRKATELAPGNRFQTVAEMVAALRDAIKQGRAATSSKPPRTPPTS